jgi:hypothetical protein
MSIRMTLRVAAVAVLALGAACDGGSTGPREAQEPVVVRVSVSPHDPSVEAGRTVQFQAAAQMSDGSSRAATVTYTATGGTVTASGLFTAPAAAGVYRVIAAAEGGTLADTATVTVTAGPVQRTLARLDLTPPTATVAAGAGVQFQTVGVYSDGSSGAVAVAYAATGGTVTAAGAYTAPQTAGTFRVVATLQGGTLADTSVVTVTAAPAPPPPTQPGNYTRVVGDDWRGYASKAQLQAADYFWWFSSHEQMFGSVYGYVDLVPDATFGQVVRITQPQQLSGSDGATPRLLKRLPAPMDRMWFRWRMKFSPGWTTVGPGPSGAANAYKIAFWTWANHDARGGLEFSNTNQYILGWSAKDRASGQTIQYSETTLPGSQDFGSATTEWSDGEWYEFVVYYERTTATTGSQRWWRRRLTSNGQIVNNPWVFRGIGISGATLPQVGEVELGANKNKTTAQAQHIYWGPWEVVDGTKFPNPWGMPNL